MCRQSGGATVSISTGERQFGSQMRIAQPQQKHAPAQGPCGRERSQPL